MASPKGNPGSVIPSTQEVHEQSSTATAPLGSELRLLDGRILVYCKAGTAVFAGKFVQAAQPVAAHANLAVNTAAAIGANTVSVTLGATAVTANQYAEGYITINAGTGAGHTYKVKSHSAAAASASLTLTLYDNVVVALDTTSKVCIVKHICDEVSPQGVTASLGVGVAQIAVSAGNYFWALKKGVTGVYNNDATAIGKGITHSAAGAGVVEVVDALGEVPIGRQLLTGAIGECRPAYIDLD